MRHMFKDQLPTRTPTHACTLLACTQVRLYPMENSTDVTRVSFDLRAISTASGGFVENPRFWVGGYYDEVEGAAADEAEVFS